MRMPRHCENGLAVAKFLKNHPKISFVTYPGLEGDKYYELAQKYLQRRLWCGLLRLEGRPGGGFHLYEEPEAGGH